MRFLHNLRLSKKISHQGAIVLTFIVLAAVWFFIFFKYHDSQKLDYNSLSSASLNDAWYYVSNGEKHIIKLPNTEKKRVPVDSDGYSRIYLDLAENFVAEVDISFYTKNQFDVVKIGEKVLESYMGINYPKWFSSSGCYFHIVTVPQNEAKEKRTLCIALTSYMKSMDGIYSEIQCGSKFSLIDHLIRRNGFKIFISILVFLFSAFLLLVAWLFRKQIGADHTLRALGFLTLLVSCWLLEESYVTQFLYANQIVHWLFNYIFFLAIPITFLYFLEELCGNHKYIGIGILTYADIIVIAVCLILQFSGKYQLTQTMFLTHIMIIVLSIYTVCFFVKEMKKNNARLKEYFVAIIILFIGCYAELAVYYGKNCYESSWIMPLTCLVFFIFLGYRVYNATVKKMQALNEAETYQKLAFIDFSTGVYNRTAYYTFIEKFVGKDEPFSIVLFDMNNLKKINDKYQHLFGDKVIKCFSDCAQNAFGKYGKIYRIGGDEFIALIKNPKVELIEKASRQFDDNVKNQKEIDYKFSVSYGYSIFTASCTADFNAGQEAADKNMYKMKSQMKQSRDNCEV